MYMYICICIYTGINLFLCTYMYEFICICKSIHIFIPNTHIHTHSRLWICCAFTLLCSLRVASFNVLQFVAVLQHVAACCSV